MKKIVLILFMGIGLVLRPQTTHAQLAIAEVIKAGVKKVVKAIDLKVQRLQNQTIWLQNAQKTLENKLSQLKLVEIADWTSKQRELYQDYFDELHQVKSVITYYHRVRTMGEQQSKLLAAYQKAWKLSKKDPHFSVSELDYMSKVYSGILNASLKNLDQVLLVISSFQTQLSDAERLEIIQQAADACDQNYFDLIEFNRQNIALSLSRAKDLNQVEKIRQWYGL